MLMMKKGSVSRKSPGVANCSRQDVDHLTRMEPFILLNELTSVLGQHYNVPLPRPSFTRSDDGIPSIKEGKKFSVGLLENPVDHKWYESTKGLSKRDRLTIGGSLFLWRKTLPSTAADFCEHRERVTAPEIVPPMGYIAHVCSLIDEIFPKGWDHKYMSLVDSAVPTIKSVLENSRGKGGYRATGPDREEYANACIGDSPAMSGEAAYRVKYMDAQCDGKTRAVTVMSSEAQILKPLHRLLYDQISNFPWLLRGKAKPASFASFISKPGEVFVSGDYESASDHLPVTTAEWILRTIFRNCRHVPESVQNAAMRYLRVTIQYPDGQEVRATRQLMGSLLCFPLLCLQNYLAFRWIFPASTPVKINGDDIVFRASREDYERWAQFVGEVGLRLSPGKTLVDPSTFSLNSTFFCASKSSVRLIPVIRCTSLLRAKSPYPSSLSGTLRAFLEGFRGDFRDQLGSWFLRKKKRLIRKCGRSVSRGLGMWVTEQMLKQSDLWHRELWYLTSVPSRYDDGFDCPTEGIPLPNPPDRLEGQVKLPAGWRRCVLSSDPKVRASQRAQERDFWDQITDLAWGSTYSPKDVERKYWREVEFGSQETNFFNWRTMRFSNATGGMVGSVYRGGVFTRKNMFTGKSMADFIFRLSGCKGPRSRLRSVVLFNWLNRPSVGRKSRVWAWVGEESEPELTDVATRFSELVKEKISLVKTMEVPYFPKCSERWLDAELAADRYVQ
uniref:RNA-dependent RNA polymerase n=1 Tax=Zhangzhou Botou tick virus 3 TaxID=2972049 RepID=A0A9E7V1Z9_9VIRU|nr:MAG: RNA-dependent RNA polymerase [Zhangzhou Botou tick virus 3]